MDPRLGWRQLRAPLPDEENARRFARAWRRLGWAALALAILAALALGLATAAAILVLASLLISFEILDALFSGMLIVVVAGALSGLLLVAILVSYLVRPLAWAYGRVLDGKPLPRWTVWASGAAAITCAIALPLTFLSILFATGTALQLISSFLGALVSPSFWQAASDSSEPARPLSRRQIQEAPPR